MDSSSVDNCFSKITVSIINVVLSCTDDTWIIYIWLPLKNSHPCWIPYPRQSISCFSCNFAWPNAEQCILSNYTVSCFPCGAWGAAHSHFMRVWIVLGWTLNCRVSYRAVEYCSCPHLLYQKYHCYKFWFGSLYSFLYHFDPARQGYFKGIPTIDPILQTLQTYKIILKAYIRHISEPQILYEVCVQWDTLINSPKES